MAEWTVEYDRKRRACTACGKSTHLPTEGSFPEVLWPCLPIVQFANTTTNVNVSRHKFGFCLV
eukprot:scaffold22143_cov41-Cyclotella_meneghiniana.AAC.6